MQVCTCLFLSYIIIIKINIFKSTLWVWKFFSFKRSLHIIQFRGTLLNAWSQTTLVWEALNQSAFSISCHCAICTPYRTSVRPSALPQGAQILGREKRSLWEKQTKPSFFWSCCAAWGILVPRPGIGPGSPAVEARSPNHWITREFPK